MNYRFSIVRDE